MFKQMDTAGTELECFQALQKQEQLAATYRITNLWEETQKQKELERVLQKRYGDLLPELQRLQHVMEVHRMKAEQEKENAAKDKDLAPADAHQSAVTTDQGTSAEVPGENNDPAPTESDQSPVTLDQGTSSDAHVENNDVAPTVTVDAVAPDLESSMEIPKINNDLAPAEADQSAVAPDHETSVDVPEKNNEVVELSNKEAKTVLPDASTIEPVGDAMQVEHADNLRTEELNAVEGQTNNQLVAEHGMEVDGTGTIAASSP